MSTPESSPLYTPNTDLWLERSRFNGMLLGGISYGIFLLLNIQATIALFRKSSHSGGRSTARILLLAYIFVTFTLATIGLAGNASWTQTIWIDQRDIPGGSPVLILTELNYWINRMALSCYYVMEWFMSLLLLYRCYVIWEGNLYIMGIMTSLFLGSVATAILVLVQSRIKNFYDINSQIAYLSLTVGTNILYTLLVVFKLLQHHRSMARYLSKEHAQTYVSVATMIVESAAMYSVLGVLYIASFAKHSNLSNLIFLDISHVQGIAQLLIILRVAEGRAYSTHDPRSRPAGGDDAPQSVMFFRSYGRTTGAGSTAHHDTEAQTLTTFAASGSQKSKDNLQLTVPSEVPVFPPGSDLVKDDGKAEGEKGRVVA